MPRKDDTKEVDEIAKMFVSILVTSWRNPNATVIEGPKMIEATLRDLSYSEKPASS